MKSIKELSDLSGSTALITGGGGFIGTAVARALSELNSDKIILLDLNFTDEQKKQLKVLGATEFITLECDLESENNIDSAMKYICAEIDKLDILVNCAAFGGTTNLNGWITPVADQSIETWKRALHVNLTSAFYLIQKCLPLLNNSDSASIINVGSIYGVYGMDMRLYEGMDYLTPAAYAASKGGLTQMTRYLATALAPNVRVNTISPGGIERGQDFDFQKRYCTKTPLNRMGTEEDLIGAFVYLATQLSNYVTGQNIIVDGGWGL